MSMFKFSAGPWNVSEGGDAFGPNVRQSISLEDKCKEFKNIGIEGVQFHDDDVVPNMNELSPDEIKSKAREVKELLDTYGLKAEFVAPRLWEDARTVDGAFTSNSEADREFALYRAFRSVDIANELGCDLIGLWFAREGTLCAESKSAIEGINRIISSINSILEYDATKKIFIEPKPNEPIDRSFCPTMGHVMAVSNATIDPSRVGGLLESAHAILAGIDPANEISFAMRFGKLFGVHLNDQNGMKYDQDKTFGAENLRQAFNQVKVLVENKFGSKGEYVGLDVKPMRTQRVETSYQHLKNSIAIVEKLERKALKFDYAYQQACVEKRDYESLEMYVINLLLQD